MVSEPADYKVMLQAGCGIVPETRSILEVWKPGMGASEIAKRCLEGGNFPNLAARTLTNLVKVAFAPRYLVDGDRPAQVLKTLLESSTPAEWSQLAYLYSARAVRLLRDFVVEVYWARYAAGSDSVSLLQAREFVNAASHQGRTDKQWSESTIQRNGSYLLRTLSDFGLLEETRRPSRKILPFSIRQNTAAVLAYDLHFRGLGDNAVVAHEDWHLFGLNETDVRQELKALSRRDLLIIQTAGDMVRISWRFSTWEDFLRALAKS